MILCMGITLRYIFIHKGQCCRTTQKSAASDSRGCRPWSSQTLPKPQAHTVTALDPSSLHCCRHHRHPRLALRALPALDPSLSFPSNAWIFLLRMPEIPFPHQYICPFFSYLIDCHWGVSGDGLIKRAGSLGIAFSLTRPLRKWLVEWSYSSLIASSQNSSHRSVRLAYFLYGLGSSMLNQMCGY